MTVRNLDKLSETEINRIIFAGAGTDQHRGLSDSLTDEQIIGLTDHPDWQDFTPGFQDWIWKSVDSIMHVDAWMAS